MNTDITHKKHSRTSGIYLIKSLLDERVYIGSATNLHARLCTHKHLLKLNKHHCKHLQNFYNKYGEENLSIIVIELCTRDKLLEREQHWLDFYKDKFNTLITAGSGLGMSRGPLTEEQKIKISKSSKGHKKSEETRRRMSESFKGRKIHTIESIKKISDKNKKAILQFNKNGEFMKRFDSLTQASEEIGTSIWNISICLCGRGKTAKGYVWKYEKCI